MIIIEMRRASQRKEELHKTNQHLTLATSQSNQKERDATKNIDQLIKNERITLFP